MNERIQELAYEAEDYADGIVDQGGEFHSAYTQKLAELIVRECMNICAEREEDIRNRIKDEGKAATAYMCRAYIKEHFGVEE